MMSVKLLACGETSRVSLEDFFEDRTVFRRSILTLDTNMNIILGLLCLSRILVGFGEGIYIAGDC
jgi:hypothetical protein